MDSSLQKKIQEIKDSNYNETIKERLIIHHTNIHKAVKKANSKSESLDRRIDGCQHLCQHSCQHYKRTFMIISPCCNKVYPCRLCHDEAENHQMDRKSIKLMKCKDCLSVQKLTSSCKNIDCYLYGVEHRYTCMVCNLFDNAERDIYHCYDCGICRVGKREDYQHCHKCSMCVLKKGVHYCTASSKNNCFVCNEDLFSSREPTTLLKCGHYIHVSCFQSLLQNNNTRCGICRKSIINMDSYWQQIDNMLEMETIPEEYQDWKSIIICNDCGESGEVKYHFVYHKCNHCNSYNTLVNKVIK